VNNPHHGPLSASVSPNPMNPTGMLAFHTGVPGPVTVTMFDPQGRVVRTLADVPWMEAGDHQVRIDAHDGSGRPLASGIYFYRVRDAHRAVSGRIVILK
jgi:hypothetical protein